MATTYLNLPILPFPDRMTFETWLKKHHDKVQAIWVRFYKKASGIPSLTYDEALDTALCYGWIDSQVKKYDDVSYLQKFTPRQEKSPWSERNKEHVARLIKEKRMQPAGLQAIDVAKANGEWDRAYATPTTMIPPPEFVEALEKNKKAKAFFESLSKTQQFYYVYWIQSAKREETKEKRLKESISMLERCEKRM